MYPILLSGWDYQPSSVLSSPNRDMLQEGVTISLRPRESEGSEEMLKVTVAIEFTPCPPPTPASSNGTHEL